MSLDEDRDPIVGLQPDGATFTLARARATSMHGVESFNVLRGGKYFFLPLLSTLLMPSTLPTSVRRHLMCIPVGRSERVAGSV